MKKKVVTLLLSLTLASSVMGCGGAKATNADVPQAQEQVQQGQAETKATPQQETEQEQTTVQEQQTQEETQQGGYDFEVKDEYSSSEVERVFASVLYHHGIAYDNTKFDGDRHYGINVSIPVKDTVKWAEEKKDLFLEQGVTYFSIEGTGNVEGICYLVFLQIQNDEKVFTREELEPFFQSDADLEVKKQLEEFREKNN